MKNLLLASAVALGVSACVMPTKQPQSADVRPVPADRLLAFQTRGATTGTVLVTRDIGMIGAGCYLGILVDGTLAATIDTGERVALQLPAGEHLLTPSWVKGRGMCGAFYDEKRMAARRRTAEVTIQAGATKAYRIHTNTDGESTLEPTL